MPSMKAIAAFQALPASDPKSFVEIQQEIPTATGRDLLIRINAISVNPVDYKERQGIEGHLDAPLILGWDACGEVVAVGESVVNFKVGDKVISAGEINRPGSYAQYQLVDERITGPKPASLSDEEAATLPLTALAAWEALFDRLKIPNAKNDAPSELLIIGGAGGVGSMAIQFARQFSNCTIIATASRSETQEWCRNLGAHHTIDHSADIKQQLLDIGYESVPYILNCSNNLPYWDIMSQLISPEGAICLLASTKAKLDLDLYMAKSVQINYQLMFTRSLFQTKTMQLQGDFLERLAEMIAAGQIKHTMTENFGPMTAESISRAHVRVESGRMIGKIVISGMQ